MPSILVTSANRGLGFELVRQYSAAGWVVHAGCRNPDGARELAELARRSEGHIRPFAMDVTDGEGVRRAAQALGDAPIDLLVNSAGIIGKPGQRFGSVDYEDWRRVFDVNTMGPVRVCEAFIENVARSERRQLVTITSGMGSIADNTTGGTLPYRTSKAAVNMAMRSIAIELAPRGITCIVINPGWVKTDMGGPNARITPEESVSAMRKVFDRLSLRDTGRFFNYDGREYPW